MSTFAAEQTFYGAVLAAEVVRQNAKSAALTTYNFVQANYAAYVTALIAADVAYVTAVVSAASTAGIDPQHSVNGPIPHAPWGKIGGH
jgi:hypothetical protein